MQDRRASALKSFQTIKHRRSGAAAVYRQNSSACGLAGPQYVVEDCQLCLPMLFVFRSTIKADFAHVHHLRQVFVKQVQLAKTQVRKLRMESQRCPNPRASLNECGRPFPCAWRRAEISRTTDSGSGYRSKWAWKSIIGHPARASVLLSRQVLVQPYLQALACPSRNRS